MDDLISREATLEAFADYVAHGMSMNDYDALWDIVAKMPSVNPQANNEDIHREREQAYMKGYEDASKRYRTEPCKDAISRTDAIRVASGYCHWTNIPKELAKLPSVNPIPCEDAISRKAVLEGLARIAKAKAKSDAQKAMMGRSMLFVERMPSVSTEKTGRWIPISVIEDIKADIKGEYVSLRHRTDEDIELGETIGLKIALGIIDSHTIAKMEGVKETETCKDCTNKCIMYDPNMKGCKDKMEGVK